MLCRHVFFPFSLKRLSALTTAQTRLGAGVLHGANGRPGCGCGDVLLLGMGALPAVWEDVGGFGGPLYPNASGRYLAQMPVWGFERRI